MLRTINTIAQIFVAIGTVAVAILAIWGEKVRSIFAGPKLEIELYDSRGSLTSRGNQKKTIYYYIRLINKRTWNPARRVRILVTELAKKRPDGTYFPERLIVPVQITWSFPQFHEYIPTIATEDICDLGFLDEDAEKFALSLYVVPNNFQGYVSAGESMIVYLKASGDNFESKSPLVLEISWDGKWSADMNEMQQHLIVKEVKKVNNGLWQPQAR